MVQDMEMPNIPLSAINVLNQRQNPGNARLLWQSTEGEWSVPMHQVITGQHILTITVKRRPTPKEFPADGAARNPGVPAYNRISAARRGACRAYALLAPDEFFRIREGHRKGSGDPQRRKAGFCPKVRLVR